MYSCILSLTPVLLLSTLENINCKTSTLQSIYNFTQYSILFKHQITSNCHECICIILGSSPFNSEKWELIFQLHYSTVETEHHNIYCVLSWGKTTQCTQLEPNQHTSSSVICLKHIIKQQSVNIQDQYQQCTRWTIIPESYQNLINT